MNRICFLLGISKNTYYHNQNPQLRFLAKYQHLKQQVEEIIEKHSSYGIRRIKQELLDSYNIQIGRDALAKLLLLWGLQLKRKVIQPKPTFIQKVLKELDDHCNLLKRTELTAPFQAMSSDMTELYYQGGKAYLCVHKDVFGQLVYGHSLGLQQTKELVISSYEQAKDKIKELLGFIPKPEMISHSDQGSQYTSYDYINTIQQEMIISYNKIATPTDNAGQESFFGRFKAEWQDEIAEIASFEELEKFVTEKIAYYNEERLHTSLGNTKPLAFTKSYLEFVKDSSV